MVIVVNRSCLSGCWDNGCQFFVSFIVFVLNKKVRKNYSILKLKESWLDMLAHARYPRRIVRAERSGVRDQL